MDNGYSEVHDYAEVKAALKGVGLYGGEARLVLAHFPKGGMCEEELGTVVEGLERQRQRKENAAMREVERIYNNLTWALERQEILKGKDKLIRGPPLSPITEFTHSEFWQTLKARKGTVLKILAASALIGALYSLGGCASTPIPRKYRFESEEIKIEAEALAARIEALPEQLYPVIDRKADGVISGEEVKNAASALEKILAGEELPLGIDDEGLEN